LRINLTWTDNATNESRFEIERCAGAECMDFVKVGASSANRPTFSDAPLVPSTTYSYRVRAGNSGGASDYSNVVVASTAAPLAAPSGITAVALSPSQIDLAWTDPGGTETALHVERCTGVGCTNFVFLALLGANVTSYSDQGLSSSTSYSYQVRAFNRDEVSPYSTVVSATTLNAPPIARYTWNCGKIKGGRQCTFNGGGSSDDVGVIGWSWDFGDGTTGSGATIEKIFGSRTAYTVSLTVRDAADAAGSKSCAVETGTSGSC
jgi:chitodextrinase